MKSLKIKTLGIILLLSLTSAFGCDRAKLTLEGFLHEGSKGVTDLKISVVKNGALLEEVEHVDMWAFYYQLDANSSYSIKFEKEGYVTKVIQVNTSVPEKTRRNHYFSFNLEMVPLDENLEETDFLVGKVHFSGESKKFHYDEEFTKFAKYQLANQYIGLDANYYAEYLKEELLTR